MSDATLTWLLNGWLCDFSGNTSEPDRRVAPANHLRDRIAVPADNLAETSDDAIFARLRAGDRDAIDALYRSTYQDLCQFARSLVHSPETAEEIVHDVFDTVLTRGPALPTTGTIRGYLFGAVRHRAHNMLRHARVAAHLEDRYDRTDAPPGHGTLTRSADETLTLEQQLAMLTTALQHLPPRQREALFLRVESQLPYADIAQALQISADAARMLVNRAEAELRRLLEPLFT